MLPVCMGRTEVLVWVIIVVLQVTSARGWPAEQLKPFPADCSMGWVPSHRPVPFGGCIPMWEALDFPQCGFYLQKCPQRLVFQEEEESCHATCSWAPWGKTAMLQWSQFKICLSVTGFKNISWGSSFWAHLAQVDCFFTYQAIILQLFLFVFNVCLSLWTLTSQITSSWLNRGVFLVFEKHAGLGISGCKPVKMACCLCAMQNFPPRIIFSKMASNFRYPNLVSQRLTSRDIACPQIWACILYRPQNSFSRPLCFIPDSSPCFVLFWICILSLSENCWFSHIKCFPCCKFCAC